ncbi:hypothetical protein IX83_05470 [Basilea psittacipulmonis DSM 24701]|uniref:Protein-L-isoaspartate O-methyltransferase n=1 Tax=Basilea psittacipulmonis DSM 24701 TaxID=1072685 RepID=A0A077DFC6_9BURK|nr:hypothetical protein IX83_05470 [Basilea psittacipulmonis DSM 24701]
MEAASTRYVNNASYGLRQRQAMIDELQSLGIRDERVLQAMKTIPRHLFVSQFLQKEAYKNRNLPIGYDQTISQPYVVAKMIELIAQARRDKVLEIGTGCGYQAAVLGKVFKQVVSIERIEALYNESSRRLKALNLDVNVTIKYGDGMLGCEQYAPYDAIILAAAGIKIPSVLLNQMAVGGCLIAPVGDQDKQCLVWVKRISETEWTQEKREDVFFVPLLSGLQSI